MKIYLNEFIKSDLYRYYGKTDLNTLLKAYLKNATFRTQVSIRLCQSKSKIEVFFGKILYKINRNKKNISISPQTKIGYGLYIGHNGPVIINPTAAIGNNVNLSQYTTIGANEGKAATIGNNVYIGPNVCVVEDVSIEDNVTIGAGAIVTKDLPKNATAAGNYARVLNFKNPARYIKNKWKA